MFFRWPFRFGLGVHLTPGGAWNPQRPPDWPPPSLITRKNFPGKKFPGTKGFLVGLTATALAGAAFYTLAADMVPALGLLACASLFAGILAIIGAIQ